MSKPFTVVVSGANRGIGKAICESIIASSRPTVLYAASRAGQPWALKAPEGSEVIFPKLDITSEQSIADLVKRVKDEQGSLDVLINNAGVNLDGNTYNAENARKTLDTNFRGTTHMCQSFLPIMSENGRIVNLSSVACELKAYSKDMQERFRDKDLTLDKLEAIAKEFEAAVSSGTEKQAGFSGPGRAYSVSKACVTGMTRVLAKENKNVAINACCPGWVETDMGNLVGKPTKSLADGAKIPVRLAIGDIDGQTGQYWANSSISGTGDGQVQQW